MTDEIKELLDHLVVCKAHIENDLLGQQAFWQSEFDKTARELADAWAAETADTPE